MTKVKRTKNIFSQNIQNQSLYQLDQQGEYKIGSLQIRSDWLHGVSPTEYIRNIYSSLKLAELRQQLEKLKDQAANSPIKKPQYDQQSSPTKTNLFKMAVIKKKINNFQVDDSGDIQKINKIIQANKTFLIAKPPATQGMLIQKLTTASIAFFQKSITRKCYLHEKQLIVESEKNKEKKDQWPKIDLQIYKLEVDYKPKVNTSPKKKQISNPFEGFFGDKAEQKKNESDSKKMFQGFEWVEGYQSRILLTKGNQRPYCLYLKNQDVQKLFKYLKFHNFQKTLQKNKGHVFDELSNQLSQKIITLFNNRLRMYDYSTKIKPNDRNIQRDPPMGKFLNTNELDPAPTTAKKSVKFNDTTAQKQNQIEKPQVQNKQSTTKKKQPIPPQPQVQDNANQSVIQPLNRRQSISHMSNMSSFKLRTKKATVFYDQLQGDIPIIPKSTQQQSQSPKGQFESQSTPNKDPSYSPQYKIQDLKLNLKEQGMSEIDQDSFSSRSVIMNRKRTTNISVSANVYKKVNSSGHEEEEEREGSRFNINIHEIESDSDDHKYSSKLKQFGSHFSLNDEQLRNAFGDDPQLIRINTGSSMSSLMLQEIDQRSDLDCHYSQPKNISPRSFHTSSSGSKQPNKMRLCLRERQPNMKAMCYEVEMLYPYYKETMSFQILQVDPEIEMQKYQVICSQSEFSFVQKVGCYPKYSRFVPVESPGQVGFTRDSDRFIFILREENHQNFFFQFNIDLQQIRYQRDKSQLILIQEQDFIYMNTDRSPTNKKSSSFAKKMTSSFHNSSLRMTNNQKRSNYKFAAILKLYISPREIEIWPELSTVQFLKKYIVMTIYDPHYDFKQNFIERKKINHELKTEVNRKCIKNILKLGLHKEDDNIKEVIFNGLPDEVVEVLEKKLQNEQKITKQKVWKLINFHTQLQGRQMRLLQDSITPVNLRTVKMMLKPLQLIGVLLNFDLYNKCLRRRLYQVGLFFLFRNPNTSIIENLVTAVCKEILLKLQNTLIRTKNEQEIKGIVKIYLEVEYEIDELFGEVRKYFN